VADVGQPIGLGEQILLIAGLRWRMLHNNLRRKQNRLDLLGLILVGLLASVFVFGMCFALFTGTYDFVSGERASWLGLLFWGIFLWWQLFPIVAAGFGVSFDFRALLRFPVSFSAFYILGLTYGIADFTGLTAICWTIAIIVGATAAKTALFPALLLVGILFVLFNIALERLLGSWIERLLAQRRSRELFFAGFILVIVSLQLLNPLLHHYENTAGPWLIDALPYFAYFPASLAG
jgi:hypothetical protein